MEIVEVIARFDLNGQITPLEMIRKGGKHRFESTGRSWRTKDGVHVLVMTHSGRTFHLHFMSDKGLWCLIDDKRRNSVPAV